MLVPLLWLIASAAVAQAGFLDLEWDAPTTNADGSPLDDLHGYRLYTALSVPPCPGPSFQQLRAPNRSPALGETFPATLAGLTPGTTYFIRVSAVDFNGNESACTPAAAGVARIDIQAAPTALQFADVHLGSKLTLDVTIHNRGAKTLTGTATTAPPFSIVSGDALSLPPGASRVVKVRFKPKKVRTFVGNVNVKTKGDDLSLVVSGTGFTTKPAVLQFNKAGYTVIEGGKATITVTRTGGKHGGVTVDYATSDGTATAGSDYTAASGTLTFAAGQMSRSFTVATVQDKAAEGPETLTLTLSNPDGGADLGAPSVATVLIKDNEPRVRFSAEAYRVSEKAGTAKITVVRIGSSAGEVTVDYAATAGTASAGPGGDFTEVTGTLTFGPGQVSRSFKVPILDDGVVDGPKTVTLQLTNPSPNAWLATPSAAVLTITDNDVAATIQFGPTQYAIPVDVGSVRPGGVVPGAAMRTGSTTGRAIARRRDGGAEAGLSAA
ncbi:MAG TPA: Calx-beta domain-containing protein [Methylomirabilota bacterium]